MKKYMFTEQEQLDEIQWLKNLANKFREPGRQQNAVGRDQLAKAQERLFGEIQNYLGLRDMSLKDLTPDLLAKFLKSNNVSVKPSDIPANAKGIVDRSTVQSIVKDLTIKSLTGEPIKYTNPNASVQQPSVLNPNRTNPQKKTKTSSPTGSATSDYLKSWTAKVKSAVDDDAKADLARELAAFLAQKTKSPDGAREVADMLATQGSSTPAPKAANPTPTNPAPAQSSQPAPKKTGNTTKSTTGSAKKSKSQSTIPAMPAGNNSNATSNVSSKQAMSDDLAAKQIASAIQGTPNLNAANLEKLVTQYLPTVGKLPTDAKSMTASVMSILQDKGLMDEPKKASQPSTTPKSNKKPTAQPTKSPTSQAAKGIEAGFSALATGAADAGRNRVASLIQQGKPPTYKNKDAIAAAKADPDQVVINNPDGSITVTGIKDKESGKWIGSEPAQSSQPAPKKTTTSRKKSTASVTSKPAKPETTTVTKGGNKITLPAMPGSKAESIQKTVKAIKEGKKLNSGLTLTSHDYKYFTKILETMNLTLKDLGLWRVLKESSDKYVKLQVR